MGSIPTSDRVSFLCSVNLSQDPFSFYTSVLIDNFLFAFFFSIEYVEGLQYYMSFCSAY